MPGLHVGHCSKHCSNTLATLHTTALTYSTLQDTFILQNAASLSKVNFPMCSSLQELLGLSQPASWPVAQATPCSSISHFTKNSSHHPATPQTLTAGSLTQLGESHHSPHQLSGDKLISHQQRLRLRFALVEKPHSCNPSSSARDVLTPPRPTSSKTVSRCRLGGKPLI